MMMSNVFARSARHFWPQQALPRIQNLVFSPLLPSPLHHRFHLHPSFLRSFQSSARLLDSNSGGNNRQSLDENRAQTKLVETSWNEAKKRSKEKNNATLKRTIEKDVGLQRFLHRVYVTAGAGITATLALPAAGILLAPQFVANAAPALMIGGFVSGLGASVALGFTKYSINAEQTQSFNSVPRQISFCALVGGMSTMLMPFALMIHEISPTIWPTATVLSFTTMGAATLWARSRPVDSLLTWEGPLYGGLAALIGTGACALIAQIFVPTSGIAALLHSVDIYGGIVLFTAMTAYETHKAVAMYLSGDPDHLGCAANVYLDFVNLLIRIAEALAKAKKND